MVPLPGIAPGTRPSHGRVIALSLQGEKRSPVPRSGTGLRQKVHDVTSVLQRHGLDVTNERLRIAVELLHDLEHPIAPTGQAVDALLRELKRAIAFQVEAE